MSRVGPTLTLLLDFAAVLELRLTSVPDSVAFIVAKVESGVEERGRGCVLPGAMSWWLIGEEVLVLPTYNVY